MGQKGIPRYFEAVLAFVALIIASPIILLCACLVRLSSDGPVFFRQMRVGLNGKKFKLYKLRTMRVEQGELISTSQDPRITRIGRILRKTKLDELPEFWNVVRGDMSLVGPRPEVPNYTDLSNPLWEKALQVRPGITDPVTLRLLNEGSLLASVEDKENFYRNVLQPYKLKCCIQYLEKRNWKSDFVVIGQTVFLLLRPHIETIEEELLSEIKRHQISYSVAARADVS